jgi:hypothetical protein
MINFSKKPLAILLIGFIFFNTYQISLGDNYTPATIYGCPNGGTPYALSDGSKTICKLSDPQQAGGIWVCLKGTAYNYATPLQSGQTIEVCGKEAEQTQSVEGCVLGCQPAYETSAPCVKNGVTYPGLFICTPIPTASSSLESDISLKAVITPYAARVTIPCNATAIGVNGQCPVADNPARYIARLYQFGLMIVGFIALGAIIYGAALYTLSAGNMASKEEGKSWMLNAIYGILLLLGAYLILYTINPSLVNLANPTVEPINLDTLLPPSTYQAASTTQTSNSPTESSGQLSDGCLVSQSTGGMFGADTTINGQQVSSLSTSNGGMECTKCEDGNDLTNGKCVCKNGLTRKSNGVCCVANAVLYKGVCTPCSDFSSQNLSASEIQTLVSQAQSQGLLTDSFDTIKTSCGL